MLDGYKECPACGVHFGGPVGNRIGHSCCAGEGETFAMSHYKCRSCGVLHHPGEHDGITCQTAGIDKSEEG